MGTRRDDAFVIDSYDERAMFGSFFPLVSAFPTPEAIAAVMPATHPLADVRTARRELHSPAGHAVRRRTGEPWSRNNVEVVRIPDELLDAHAVEVADVLAHPPPRTPYAASTQTFAPIDEHRDAQLSLLRRRVDVDPIEWATRVAQTDERGMIAVAEHARDWAPWVPMLRFALSLREVDDANLVLRAAEHRLRLVARRMLDAMTLTQVLVDDTLNIPPVMQRALSSVLDREVSPL